MMSPWNIIKRIPVLDMVAEGEEEHGTNLKYNLVWGT